MATSGPDSHGSPLASRSSTGSQPSSPSDTTHLMSNTILQRNHNHVQERRVFHSPAPRMASLMTNLRRFPSPRIYAHARGPTSSPPPPGLVRSVSEDVAINSSWNSHHDALGAQKASSMIVGNPNASPQPGLQESQHHHSRISVASETHHMRQGSRNEAVSLAPFRSASIISDGRVGGLLSRSSTRRSFGREWTRNHWEKVRDLVICDQASTSTIASNQKHDNIAIEQESERARRCSKLSSGFAPLMVFGGLVFICIGVSATTNTGKDRDKLKKLSAAPMAMGVFMLALGIFLIACWFGCRGRAKGLEQQVLHGSRRNSIDDNLVQNLISKLYVTSGVNRRQTSSPSLPGVTLDGVNVLKPQTETENHAHHQQDGAAAGTPGCCSRCGAANAATQVILETTI